MRKRQTKNFLTTMDWGSTFGFHETQMWTPSPLWLGSFWFAFSALLSGPMKWFIRFPLIAILGGMIGGPFSYWGGAQMQGLIFPQYWEMSLIIND